jgi:hypothetical protein
MAELGPRFCPRCGTERVAGLPFCPSCGLNLEQLAAPSFAPGGDATAERPAPAPTLHAATGPDFPPHPPATSTETAPAPSARVVPTVSGADRERPPRQTSAPALVAILVVLLVVGLALAGTGLGGRIGAPGSSTAAPSPTVAGPTLAPTSEAPPFGLAILSPLDGAVVGSHQVTVIGSAPAGITVVHDVPMWFDSRTTADGTGHWAMTVDLNKGENRLKFRLGDDKSTSKEIRVTYSPAGG